MKMVIKCTIPLSIVIKEFMCRFCVHDRHRFRTQQEKQLAGIEVAFTPLRSCLKICQWSTSLVNLSKSKTVYITSSCILAILELACSMCALLEIAKRQVFFNEEIKWWIMFHCWVQCTQQWFYNVHLCASYSGNFYECLLKPFNFNHSSMLRWTSDFSASIFWFEGFLIRTSLFLICWQLFVNESVSRLRDYHVPSQFEEVLCVCGRCITCGPRMHYSGHIENSSGCFNRDEGWTR